MKTNLALNPGDAILARSTHLMNADASEVVKHMRQEFMSNPNKWGRDFAVDANLLPPNADYADEETVRIIIRQGKGLISGLPGVGKTTLLSDAELLGSDFDVGDLQHVSPKAQRKIMDIITDQLDRDLIHAAGVYPQLIWNAIKDYRWISSGEHSSKYEVAKERLQNAVDYWVWVIPSIQYKPQILERLRSRGDSAHFVSQVNKDMWRWIPEWYELLATLAAELPRIAFYVIPAPLGAANKPEGPKADFGSFPSWGNPAAEKAQFLREMEELELERNPG